MERDIAAISIQYKGDLDYIEDLAELRHVVTEKFNKVSGILDKFEVTDREIQAIAHGMAANVPEKNFAGLERALEKEGFAVYRDLVNYIQDRSSTTEPAKPTKMDQALIDLVDAFAPKSDPNEYVLTVLFRSKANLPTDEMATPFDPVEETRLLDNQGQAVEGVRINLRSIFSGPYEADVTLNGLERLDSDDRIVSIHAPPRPTSKPNL